MTEPLYKKVYNILLERIASSEYVPGSMLPSEFDIATELGVSQGTARKALAALEQKRIVERRQGKGTFVTLRTPKNSLFHFFRLRSADGAQINPELLSEVVRTRAARKSEQQALFGKPERVFEITRIRSFDKTPLCHETIVVPSGLFPGLKDRSPLPNALYVLYQQAYSCIIVTANENLVAGTLDEQMAEKLEKSPGTPVLIAHRQALDLRDRVVELRTSVYVTETASYRVDLQ